MTPGHWLEMRYSVEVKNKIKEPLQKCSKLKLREEVATRRENTESGQRPRTIWTDTEQKSSDKI